VWQWHQTVLARRSETHRKRHLGVGGESARRGVKAERRKAAAKSGESWQWRLKA